MNMKPEPPLVVYVDVDNTLVTTRGTKRVPELEIIKHVFNLKQDGAELFCWSSLGADYARRIAGELNITHCFSGFLPKPHVTIDDQAITDWLYFRHFYPSQATRYDVAEYRKQLESWRGTSRNPQRD